MIDATGTTSGQITVSAKEKGVNRQNHGDIRKRSGPSRDSEEGNSGAIAGFRGAIRTIAIGFSLESFNDPLPRTKLSTTTSMVLCYGKDQSDVERKRWCIVVLEQRNMHMPLPPDIVR